MDLPSAPGLITADDLFGAPASLTFSENQLARSSKKSTSDFRREPKRESTAYGDLAFKVRGHAYGEHRKRLVEVAVSRAEWSRERVPLSSSWERIIR